MKTNIRFKRYIKRNDLTQVKRFSILTYGRKMWFLNKNLHREDGPAIDYDNGTKEWYLEGYWFRKEKDYWKELKRYKKES